MLVYIKIFTDPKFAIAIENSSSWISCHSNRFLAIDVNAPQTLFPLNYDCMPLSVTYIDLKYKKKKCFWWL